MNDTTKLYKKIYKISQMGMGATATILTFYEGDALSQELAAQNNEYRRILADARKQISNQCCYCKAGLSPIEKMTSYCMVKINLMMNKCDSRISEMIINGCTMGIINAIKAQKCYSSADDGAKTLLQKLIDYQTGTIERMKNFL